MPSRRRRTDPAAIAFASVLRWLRLERNLSQEELAHRANVHPTYVGRIERGLQSPTVAVIFKLAAGLDVPAPELIRMTGAFGEVTPKPATGARRAAAPRSGDPRPR